MDFILKLLVMVSPLLFWTSLIALIFLLGVPLLKLTYKAAHAFFISVNDDFTSEPWLSSVLVFSVIFLIALAGRMGILARLIS